MFRVSYAATPTVKDAVQKLQSDPEAKLLAGGMTLLPTMKLRLASPSELVDLGPVEDLRGIDIANDKITIGAMTRHVDVAKDRDLHKALPALAELAGGIGDPQVRNRGTIGGSVANNDPAADYPAALLALGATVNTDRRKIKADEFFVDMFETALEDDEVITAVEFPTVDFARYLKFPNPASRYAIVGVFVARRDNEVRVAVTGAGASVFRFVEAEKALSKSFSVESLINVSCSADDLNDDLHASAEYRAELVKVLTERAVQDG